MTGADRSTTAGRGTFSPPRLRAIRAVKRRTRDQLARDAGLSPEMVAALEHGPVQPPSADTVDRLAAALGCRPVDLDLDPAEADDPASQYWAAATAALPPLTQEAAEQVGNVLRRIAEPPTSASAHNSRGAA